MVFSKIRTKSYKNSICVGTMHALSLLECKTKKAMILNIQNLGALKEAEIDLSKDLILLCGHTTKCSE